MVTLSHPDKSKIDALDAELSNRDNESYRSIGEFFNHLRPNPSGEWQYDWSVENWGSKWDAGIIDFERRDDTEIWVSFESAWSPPTALYEFLMNEGWKVYAVYYEPGMGYGGIFDSENGGDDYYELDWTSREVIENLPGDLIDFGDLLTKFDEYEVERIEEEWGDAERTDWYPMSVEPVREGCYEIQVKGYEGRSYTQFVKFEGTWEICGTDNMLGWRGLAQDPNEADQDQEE
jgi:hypothetical protein